MSEKVARGHARRIVGSPHKWFDVPSLREKAAFDEDEAVVVIPASEYEALRRDASLWRINEGGPGAVYGTPRKRCMNCDGNNVNAPCTCEEV